MVWNHFNVFKLQAVGGFSFTALPLPPTPPPTPTHKPSLSVASSPHWKVVVWTFLKHGFDHFLKTCLRVERRAAAPARSEETP